MKLSRDAIQRMVNAGGGSGGGGGLSTAALEAMLSAYAQRSWVDKNYQSIEFFSKMFRLHSTEAGGDDDLIEPNGELPEDTSHLNIEAMFGFWTELYVSALGKSPTGQPASLFLSSLGDVAIPSPQDGQVLTFNSGMWVAQTPASGVDMSQVWAAMAAADATKKIDNSHLKLDTFFTELTNANNQISMTIGGMTKTLTVAYAAAAGVADRLSGNATYSAWGQTYWSLGTPNDISGNMTSVGNITMQSGDHSIMTTSGNLILGYSNNEWVEVMDICSYNGSNYWNIHQSGDSEFANVYSRGYVTALSDIRYKEVVNHFRLDVETIASASIIHFRWKDGNDRELHVGGIAQEWQKILPEAVHETKDGKLSLDYGLVGMVSAVSVAHKVAEQQQRIDDLESRLKKLESMILR